MKYKPTFRVGMAGKVGPNDIIEEWERPRFGRFWWFWVPSFGWNGGRFSRGEIVDTGVKWLCFWFDVTFWPAHMCPGKP